MHKCFSLFFVIYNFCSLCLDFLPSRADYVPALLWTSRQYQDRTYLNRNQIDSALFKSYLSEIFSKGQPLVIVFLEPYLTSRDLPTSANIHPFLSDLSKEYRIDKFDNVESPYQVLLNLTADTYTWNKWTVNPDIKEFTAWTLQFDHINGSRSEVLKAHNAVISTIDKNLKTLRKDWIALYTGKTGSTVPKPRSAWYLGEAEEDKNLQKALTIYQDEYTGFTVIIRGRIQLFLPNTSGDFTPLHLGNHSFASEKRSDLKGKINFVITFPSYTLTFFISTVNRDWVIEKIKIANEDGESLSLMAKTRILLPQHKCIDHFYEFQSLKQPLIKVKIAKYKIFRLNYLEEFCRTPYRFHVISSFMFLFIMTIALFWDTLLKNENLPKKNKIVKVSTETLVSFRSDIPTI